MGRTIDEAIEMLPADRRAKIEARAAELIAEELSLGELRKAMRLTQADLAKRLGVRQDTISRAEQRADMLLSTLQKLCLHPKAREGGGRGNGWPACSRG